MSPNIPVKVLDMNSRSPLSNVTIKVLTTHYTGVKTLEKRKTTIGETDATGEFTIDGLNLYARDHVIAFLKPGYDSMFLVVREYDGQSMGQLADSENKDASAVMNLTEFLPVVVPMRRK